MNADIEIHVTKNGYLVMPMNNGQYDCRQYNQFATFESLSSMLNYLMEHFKDAPEKLQREG